MTLAAGCWSAAGEHTVRAAEARAAAFDRGASSVRDATATLTDMIVGVWWPLTPAAGHYCAVNTGADGVLAAEVHRGAGIRARGATPFLDAVSAFAAPTDLIVGSVGTDDSGSRSSTYYSAVVNTV
ncbi:hypothetical protein ACFVVM_10295 [Nocardia sp. NPDC058176]|uniref:hypothetical protein n=1 Tax=Nocardia sp. NPDC058176 TaxID=3346368 RepID=UPI0036D7CC1D